MDILEGLKILNLVIPGANSDSILLYAAEIKLYARHLLVNGKFQTSISGLYAAANGAGLSRGIVTPPPPWPRVNWQAEARLDS